MISQDPPVSLAYGQVHIPKLLQRLAAVGLSGDFSVPREGNLFPAVNRVFVGLISQNRFVVFGAGAQNLSEMTSFPDAAFSRYKSMKPNNRGVGTLCGKAQTTLQDYAAAKFKNPSKVKHPESNSKQLMFAGELGLLLKLFFFLKFSVGSAFGNICGPIEAIIRDDVRLLREEFSEHPEHLEAELNALHGSYKEPEKIHKCFSYRAMFRHSGEVEEVRIAEGMSERQRANEPYFIHWIQCPVDCILVSTAVSSGVTPLIDSSLCRLKAALLVLRHFDQHSPPQAHPPSPLGHLPFLPLLQHSQLRPHQAHLQLALLLQRSPFPQPTSNYLPNFRASR